MAERCAIAWIRILAGNNPNWSRHVSHPACWLLSCCCLLVAGCGTSANSTSAPRPESRRADPALQRLLAYCDPRYDPDEQMLKVEFSSPGYHSRVASGTPVHPTRESLMYALALLQRDDPGDVRRAESILHRVLPLQDTAQQSPTCGVWPWLLEEPLDAMAAPDPNWADFLEHRSPKC